MFYYGVIFKGISRDNINFFIKEILDIKQKYIISSHLFTDDLGDFEYSDKLDLSVCVSSCAGNIYIEQLSFHRPYHNVLCLIYDDNNCFEVECSIAESDFSENEIPELKKWFNKLCDKHYISGASVDYDYDF